MKILLDGVYFSSGTLENVSQQLLSDDPTFDVSRLSYEPDDLRKAAGKQITDFASRARYSIIQEPDSLRRDGWTLKGVLALMVIANSDPDTLNNVVTPAVIGAFTEEAARRGLNETAQELMSASVQKMLGMLFATGLVEGNQRGVEKAIADSEPDQIPALLEGAKAKAAQDMAALPES